MHRAALLTGKLTRLMYTLGCPRGPSPPSQNTTRSVHSLGGTSSIILMPQFSFT